jgi:quercetin dioxygenase-like cupin family protein
MSATTMQPGVIRRGEGKPLNVMGHTVAVKLSRRETGGNYYVFEVTSPPGFGIPPHVHEREDELITVLEGEYTVMLGADEIVANAGDEIFFPRGIPHAFRNSGTTPGRTLWTVVPGGSFEEFFEELGALPADGEPDLAVVGAIFARYGMTVLVPDVVPMGPEG